MIGGHHNMGTVSGTASRRVGATAEGSAGQHSQPHVSKDTVRTHGKHNLNPDNNSALC